MGTQTRGTIGQVLNVEDGADPFAPAGATADVTLRRFWSQGPRGVKNCGQGSRQPAPAAKVTDLATWKRAMEAVR
jgi:hypothetical protein